jgi:hypothetical protein
MSDWLLTFELTGTEGELEIHCDPQGLRLLISKLTTILATGQHDHLATPSWAGNELTELPQRPDGGLIHQVTIRYWPAGGDGKPNALPGDP